jgi:hypothetical protein
MRASIGVRMGLFAKSLFKHESPVLAVWVPRKCWRPPLLDCGDEVIEYVCLLLRCMSPVLARLRKPLAARIDSANWGEADSNAVAR